MVTVTRIERLNMTLTGAEVVADFVARFLHPRVFLVTGGACAFIVDAIGEHHELDYVCFQHEQAAAMAADAVWRTRSQIGVTVATSGPGATNLITGIACSWFDSIPSFHITGQVNDHESSAYLGANVRQAGFQETDIVSMVQPITKFAKRVHSVRDLCDSLLHGLKVAQSARMGPILIDIPMNVQKETISIDEWLGLLSSYSATGKFNRVFPKPDLSSPLRQAQRPLVLLGGGLVSGKSVEKAQEWCLANRVPFVSSWTAMPFINRENELYLGCIGVYGARLANWAVQACDTLLSLGSRLDNRQRTSNPRGFAPYARKIVVDVDEEELKKFDDSYECFQFDLSQVEDILPPDQTFLHSQEWITTLSQMRLILDPASPADSTNQILDPYESVRVVQRQINKDAIVVSDCGANLCWVYQAFLPSSHFLFTAYGNSPMGYSLPAAIGASLTNPNRQIVCFIGDGGLQMNVQELQTVVHYRLPIKIFIQNNYGYGIIKQFQDANFSSRYHASGHGYSIPSFEEIAKAYGIRFKKAKLIEDLVNLDLSAPEPEIFEICLSPHALIVPKVEGDRFLHDQFPYSNDSSIELLPYLYPRFPSQI